MRLEGKVAIITGAGGGFGRGIAEIFAREGARVVAVDSDLQAGESTVGGIAERGGQAIFVLADLSNGIDAERLAAIALAKYEAIDVLVNNATMDGSGGLTECPGELGDWHLGAGFASIGPVSQHVIPHMKEAGRGSIVNIASISGLNGQLPLAAYSASKGRIIALTQQMAAELAPFGIRCNCVGLALEEMAVADGLAEQAIEFRGAAEKGDVLDRIHHSTLLPGGTSPADIAHAALYLASDEAFTVTGANLLVDGSARVIARRTQHV